MAYIWVIFLGKRAYVPPFRVLTCRLCTHACTKKTQLRTFNFEQKPSGSKPNKEKTQLD